MAEALKKPEARKFWVVMYMVDGKGYQVSDFYGNNSSAIKEAKRLSGQQPEREFYIMEGHAKVTTKQELSFLTLV